MDDGTSQRTVTSRFSPAVRYGALALGLVLVAAAAGLATQRGIGFGFGAASAPTATPLPAVQAVDEILAEARVVPVRSSQLSFPLAGVVAEIYVQEGDLVAADAPLVRLDDDELAVAEAEARANLAAAEAQFTQTIAGASEAEIAAAQAASDEARAGLASARGGLTSASAALSGLQAGASSEEIAVAERRAEQARNELWGAQNQRDGICGRVGDFGVEQSDCDGAKSRVGVAEEQVRIADLELARLRRGAEASDLSASKGQVSQAAGQMAAAEARVRQADAQLASLLNGATPEEIAVADARVQQAQAALDLARLRRAQALIQAPFAGTVSSIDVDEGQRVGPTTPAVIIADLTAFRVETDDLTELSVVHVAPGDAVTLRFDALPDLEIPGTVDHVKPLGENKLGDITYTVVVTPRRQDDRLRWNMTATVVIQTESP